MDVDRAQRVMNKEGRGAQAGAALSCHWIFRHTIQSFLHAEHRLLCFLSYYYICQRFASRVLPRAEYWYCFAGCWATCWAGLTHLALAKCLGTWAAYLAGQGTSYQRSLVQGISRRFYSPEMYLPLDCTGHAQGGNTAPPADTSPVAPSKFLLRS